MPRRKKIEGTPALDVNVGDVVYVIHPIGAHGYHKVIEVDRAGGLFKTDDLLRYDLGTGVEVDEPFAPRKAEVLSGERLAEYNERNAALRLADELMKISTEVGNFMITVEDAYARINELKEGVTHAG